MGRISATFKNSIEGMCKAYAEYHNISFSEAVESLAGATVSEWFNKQPKAIRSMLNEKYNIIPKTNPFKAS
jgi:hypothetical protein